MKIKMSVCLDPEIQKTVIREKGIAKASSYVNQALKEYFIARKIELESEMSCPQ